MDRTESPWGGMWIYRATCDVQRKLEVKLKVEFSLLPRLLPSPSLQSVEGNVFVALTMQGLSSLRGAFSVLLCFSLRVKDKFLSTSCSHAPETHAWSCCSRTRVTGLVLRLGNLPLEVPGVHY